jgi:hypothetical protein
MRKFIDEIIFGKNSLVSGMLALSVIAAIGLGCFCNKDKLNLSNIATPTPNVSPSPSATKAYIKADASKAQIPSDDEMQDIVKKTMLDFNDAIKKADFADFHTTISKVWQKQITASDLQTNFQAFIDGKADMSDIRSMTAKFNSAPEITRSSGTKTLEANGEYPTTPNASTFELKYIPEGKEWKLIGLKVYTNITKKY